MMVNIIKNSMEAIDELADADGLKETPRICIHAYPEGNFLHIDVIDNGIGIDTKNTRSTLCRRLHHETNGQRSRASTPRPILSLDRVGGFRS